MNFDFSEEQYSLRDNVSDLLADHWSMDRVRKLMNGMLGDSDLAARFREIGLPMLLVPQQYGGLGLSVLDLVLVSEEFGKSLVPGRLQQTLLASDVVARFGTAAQKETILPGIAAGKAHVAFAWLEPGAGFDLGEIAMTAVDRRGVLTLDGRKLLVPYAASAGLLLVAVRLPTGELGLVLRDVRSDGMSCHPHHLIDPTSEADQVNLNGVSIEPAALLGGGPDRGAIQRLFDLNALGAAAEMVGCAARALDMAVTYAKQRQQFGKPIGSFQAIKHKCADMYVALETSRSAVYYAAWALSEDQAVAASAVSMAKAFAGDACRLICNESMQIHGGIGYTWDYDLHLLMKRGKYLEYSFGDASWHRERVLARALPSPGAVHHDVRSPNLARVS